MNLTRGKFSEISLYSLSQSTRKSVENLFDQVCKSDKIDEHGNWEFGIDFNRKGVGYATNWDLYGVGKDYFSKRLLIVVQIRQFVREKKGYFPSIRKSYFLIGRNEDNTAFAHPVEGRVVHNAIKNKTDVIRACQNWMFGGDYTKMLRQGDLALLPIKSTGVLKGAQGLQEGSIILQKSHELLADELRQNGYLYAKNPFLHHIPETHPDIAGEGWYKVIVSKRGNFYNFAVPTID